MDLPTLAYLQVQADDRPAAALHLAVADFDRASRRGQRSALAKRNEGVAASTMSVQRPNSDRIADFLGHVVQFVDVDPVARVMSSRLRWNKDALIGRNITHTTIFMWVSVHPGPPLCLFFRLCNSR